MADSSIDPEILKLLAQGESSSDPSKNFVPPGSRTFLGNPVSYGLPGGSDINVGAGPAPAPGVNVGAPGTGGGAVAGGGPGAGGGVGGRGGTNDLSLLSMLLGGGDKAASILKLLGGDLTRGNVGGPDTPQDSNTSLSDRLRSAMGDLTPFKIPGDVLSGAGGGSAGAFDFANATPFKIPEATEIGGGTFSTAPGSQPFSGLTASPESSIPGGNIGGALGAGVGEAGSLFSLAQAVQSGDPIQIGSAAASLGVSTAALVDAITPILPALTALEATGYGAAIASAIASTTAFAEDLAHNSPGGIGRAILDAGAMGIPVAGEGFADAINNAFSPSESWQTFGTRLGQTLGTEGRGLSGIEEALPGVQSKQDLQNLVSAYKQSVERGGVPGYSKGGSNPYEIPGLPGATGTTHEGEAKVDFTRPTQDLQSVINALLPTLPDQGGKGFAWESFFNMPGKGLAGSETLMKATMPDGSVQYGTAADFEASKMNFQARTVKPLAPGSPEYDQAAGAAGLFTPPPTSSYWQRLMSGPQAAAAPAPTLSPELISMLASGGATGPPAGPGTPLPDVWQDFLKQQQAA